MINKIKDVLVELGKGFSFVGNQYKVSTNDNDYYRGHFKYPIID